MHGRRTIDQGSHTAASASGPRSDAGDESARQPPRASRPAAFSQSAGAAASLPGAAAAPRAIPSSAPGRLAEVRDFPAPEPVLVSVIVPVRDEAAVIRQTGPRIVGQRSTARSSSCWSTAGRPTGRVRCSRSSRRTTPRVKLLDNPAGDLAGALQIGLKHARGEFVSKMDAHTFYAPDYLQGGHRSPASRRRGLGQRSADAVRGRPWLAARRDGAGNAHGCRRVAQVGDDLQWQRRARRDRARHRRLLRRLAQVDARGDRRLGSRVADQRGLGARRALPRRRRPHPVPEGHGRALRAAQHPARPCPAVLALWLLPGEDGAAARQQHAPLPPAADRRGPDAASRAAARRRRETGGPGRGSAYLGAVVAACLGATRGARTELLALPVVLVVLHWSWGAGFLAGSARFGPPLGAIRALLRRR